MGILGKFETSVRISKFKINEFAILPSWLAVPAYNQH